RLCRNTIMALEAERGGSLFLLVQGGRLRRRLTQALDGNGQHMIVVAGLNKREVRRMLLLGIPWFVTTLICTQSLSSVWLILFAFVALLPYSYFYVLAYTNVQANIGRPPGWRFYLGSVVVQLLVIGLMWAGASI
ncbi:hypothetical protein, partial [Dyella ginsengisoli]|uniref:hypothetical protein n=1 Tax=Dyella ginsengisoli TaxID=363848 RepID=UPI001F51B34C